MSDPRDGIFFQPWIGADYLHHERLLILGESHYATTDAHDRELTRRVAQSYVDGRWTHRFWTLLARTVAGRHLSLSECRSLWKTFAFYNFVQQALPRPRARPTPVMWTAGVAPFLCVLAELEPRCVLVIGRELWRHLPEAPDVALAPNDETAWPGRRYEAGGKSIIATYIHHPASRGFSARKWSDVVTALRTAT